MGKYVTNWDKYPNFRRAEFKCKCGKCDGYGKGIATSLVDTMQKLRTKYNKAINISSGYRCIEHNKKVGGSKTSKHMQGLACDFYFKDGSLGNQNTRVKIVDELKKTKYYRYSYCNVNGNNPNMGSAIHLDTLLVDIEDDKETIVNTNLDNKENIEENNEIENIEENNEIENIEENKVDNIIEEKDNQEENVIKDIIKDENARKFNVICTCLLTVINFLGRSFKKVIRFFIKD